MARKGAQGSKGKPAAAQPASDRAADCGRTEVVFAVAHRHGCVDFRKGDSYWATPDEVDLLRYFNVIEVR